MRVLKRFSFHEAERLHKKQWLEGKHKEWGDDEHDYFFPYGDQYKSESFVEVEIPTKEIESVAHTRKRIEQYKEILKERGEKSMGSLWVSAGMKMKDGTIQRSSGRLSFSALDGNHRLKAAQELGHPLQIVIMPESHWDAYTKGSVVVASYLKKLRAKY